MPNLPLLVALLAAQPAAEVQAPLPPPLPWHGVSEQRIVPAGDPWITPAEASGFETTPDYAATRAFIDRLVAAAPRLLRVERFGQSAEGRELYAVIARRDDGRRRPAVLIQAGIHAGEIDGKDAGLMLLRDIAVGGRADLLDGVDLVFVPIFNVDGHERASRFSRPNQRGPREQGWRATATNRNLNRDYLKADTPEMRAMLALLQRVDPVLYFDIHVTDGIDYQYDITYGYHGHQGRYAQSPAIGRWLDQRLRPAIDAALTRAGHIPGPLVFAVDDRNPRAGIADSPFGGRFSHGYGDLARIPTVLVENHSLKPYRQRVLGTYVLIEEALRLAAREGAAIRTAIAADRADRPQTMTLSWRPVEAPTRTVRWRGIAHRTAPSPITGRDEIQWLNRAETLDMPVFTQEPATRTTLPRAWWVPAGRPEIVERLRLHGVQFETFAAPRQVTLETVRLQGPTLGNASEGRVPVRFTGLTRRTHAETMPAGSIRVPADQPRALIAAALLESESPESLLAWGFFADILGRVEYMEAYAIEPMARAMLAADPGLRRQFDEALRDPAFAASPDRRLAWFYERSAYVDDRYLLYPIGREIDR